MEYDGNITLHKNSDRSYSPESYLMQLRITSKKLSDRLVELGMMQAKTKIITFPKYFSVEICKHFIRGYFDGDGCISLTKRKQMVISIASTKEFCEGIQEIVKNECNIPGNVSFHRNIYYYAFSGNTQVKRFMNFLYSDGGLCLYRKRDKYLNSLKEIYGNDQQNNL